MINICVVTTTRAEYGLLRPLIKKINEDAETELSLIVSGTHLSDKFGHTIDEIIKDGFPIAKTIEIPLDTDSSVSMAESISSTLTSFSKYLSKAKPSLLVILGDRYEAFAVATAASVCRIPIAHIHGGETTEGAMDEFFRHSITKMSYLHFTSCEAYRQRVIQLGESPNRAFNVGALGIENIKKLELLSNEEIVDILGIDKNIPYCMITYHPVTMENSTVQEQFGNLLIALDNFTNMQFVFTKANADIDGDKINEMIDEYSSKHENIRAFFSLGVIKYLSALKYSKMIIGNSSSGIIEAPSFDIPTINIGDRQKGRIQAKSIINCVPDKNKIISSINNALTCDYTGTENPYEGKNTSFVILSTIKNIFNEDKINLKKTFYDIQRYNNV